jgi:hypothetical protein
MKLLLICIIILLIILILISFYSKKYLISKYIENFENTLDEIIDSKIIFISKDDLFQILKNNNDNYYNTFYNNDFKTRNITNIENYINFIQKSASDFNDDEKEKILKCIKTVNKVFKNIKLDWFDGIKANLLNWKFGCVSGKLYENGLPHTRNDIIIISKEDINNNSEKKLTKTLLHEKIHIYQKIYNDDVEKYIKKNNFYKFKKRSFTDNIRANPDLDNWIYKDENNILYKALYNDDPESIEDITYFPINNQSHEHPFEKMAIEMEKYLI